MEDDYGSNVHAGLEKSVRFMECPLWKGFVIRDSLGIRPGQMFPDDTNLFYSGKDIHSLFNAVPNELLKISHWFNINKLTVNADKTTFTLFHKAKHRDDIPLVLPTLKINEPL